MRQMLQKEDWDLMSESVHEEIIKYLIQKDWGTVVEGEFVPYLQLNIGQLIEMCQDNGIPYTITDKLSDIVDYLWKRIVRHYGSLTTQ